MLLLTARRLALVNDGEPTEGRMQEYGEDQSFLRPYGSEPWRGFCRHGTNYFGRSSVAVQTIWCVQFKSVKMNMFEDVSVVSRYKHGRSQE